MAPTRTHLTIAQKNELRAHHADNPRMNYDDLRLWTKERSQREIGRSIVSTIVSKPQQRALNTTIKHSRPCLYPEMESELLAFVDAIEEAGVLSDLVLYEKASMLLALQTAKVSLGWVQKFKRRHGICLRRIHEESDSVDISDMERQQRQLRDLLDEYSPADVYNFDETRLFSDAAKPITRR